jgi:carboxylate-amine ligase
MDGTLIDLVAGDETSAHQALHRLLDYVRPDCEDHGEWDELSERVAGVVSRGNGAQRQRAALRAAGRMRDVTRMIVDATAPTPG